MMNGFSSALVVQHFEDLKYELPSWVEFPDPDPAPAEGANPSTPDQSGYSCVLQVGSHVYMARP